MRKLLNRFPSAKGFTLIELLIVIAIIAALAISVVVALNPSKRIQDAQNAARTSDVATILTAIHASIVDNKGLLPSNMPAASTETQLGTDASGCGILTGGSNVTAAACANLMLGTRSLTSYLKSMPVDPSGGTTYTAGKTGYSVTVDTNNIVTVRACGKEGAGNNISASR